MSNNSINVVVEVDSDSGSLVKEPPCPASTDSNTSTVKRISYATELATSGNAASSAGAAARHQLHHHLMQQYQQQQQHQQQQQSPDRSTTPENDELVLSKPKVTARMLRYVVIMVYLCGLCSLGFVLSVYHIFFWDSRMPHVFKPTVSKKTPQLFVKH